LQVVRAAVRFATGLSAIPGETDPDGPVDSQLVRIGLDVAGPWWSIASGQGRFFRGQGWTGLDPTALLDTQEVAGSKPLRPTFYGPRISAGGYVVDRKLDTKAAVDRVRGVLAGELALTAQQPAQVRRRQGGTCLRRPDKATVVPHDGFAPLRPPAVHDGGRADRLTRGNRISELRDRRVFGSPSASTCSLVLVIWRTTVRRAASRSTSPHRSPTHSP
jgi:hypothetical protein